MREIQQQTLRVGVSGGIIEFSHATREIETQNDGILLIHAGHACGRVKNESILHRRQNALEEGSGIQRFKRHIFYFHVVRDLFVRTISDRSHRAFSRTRISAGFRSFEGRTGSARCGQSTDNRLPRSPASLLVLTTSLYNTKWMESVWIKRRTVSNKQ